MKKRNKLKAILMALNMTALLSGCNVIQETHEESKIESTNENDATLSLYNHYLEQMGSTCTLTEEDLKAISEKMNEEITRIILKGVDGSYYPTFENFGDIVEDESKNTIYLINNNIYNKEQDFKLDEFSWQAVPNIEYNRIANLGNFIKQNNIESIGYIPVEWDFWNNQYKEYIQENYGYEVLRCLEECGYPASVYEVEDLYSSYRFNKLTKVFELTETAKTLNIYNAYLKSIGSTRVLTEEDLKFIYTSYSEQKGMLIIKTNNDKYTQVGFKEYNVVENANEEIRLLLGIKEPNCDLFTGEKLPLNEVFQGYTKLANLGEYIENNGIQAIGYKSVSGWSSVEEDFILRNYDEEVLECLKENGFPVEVYVANDFYDAHRKEKFNAISFSK